LENIDKKIDPIGDNKGIAYYIKNSISWRIAMTVFITIAIVQIVVLIINIKKDEVEMLNNARNIAQAVLLPSLEQVEDQNISPLKKNIAEYLFKTTIIKGLSIYNLDKTVIKAYGLPTIIYPSISKNGTLPDYRSSDGRFYEVLFVSGQIELPYYIVARLDSSNIATKILNNIYKTLIIIFIISILVTSVLMFVLKQWLLNPIKILSSNLLKAAQNYDNPSMFLIESESHDEIGIAIRIANSLIRQNALNLKRLKTQAEDKIHALAYFDNLTGLPNRTYFIEKLDERINKEKINDDFKMAVFSIDLDHFKDINDTMGHDAGNRILEVVSKRLAKSVPDTAIISRSSADEFIVMAALKGSISDSSSIVDGLFDVMVDPVHIMQESFQIRISVGVAHYPNDGIDAGQIIKNANIALSRAKEEGRDTVRYYSEDFNKSIQERFKLLRDLRVALDKNELEVYYHPQFNLKTGQMIGAEALLRWWKPDSSKEGGHFISPLVFIPIAEQSGLIVEIGEYVLRTACEKNKAWQEHGMPPIKMAVNLSAEQFHRCDIVSQLNDILEETGLDPKWLELEVTESVFMEDMQSAIDILHQFHHMGIEIAIDDFGTGYSSLSYLRQFPIDRLKIDQSFIRNALTDNDDKQIVRTIIALGHSLNLKIIAEGVETIEHEDFLKKEGCDESQGFKYTKPIPENAFLDFSRQYNQKLAKEKGFKAVD